MEQEHEPFRIRHDRRRIVIEGDLGGSPQVLEECRVAALQAIAHGPSNLFILAHDARIDSGGVETWLRVVEEFLMDCNLTYAPSQLGVILQYEELYRHPHSQYEEYSQYRTLEKAEQAPPPNEAWV